MRVGSPLVDAVVDVAREVGEPLGEAFDAVAVPMGGGEAALDQLLGPRHGLGRVLLREAEDVHGRRDGKGAGEGRDQVGLPLFGKGVEQRLRLRLDVGLGRLHRLRREGRDHDPPDERVVRRVELAERPVLHRHDDTRRLEPLGAGEAVGVPEQPAAFAVACDVGDSVADVDHRRLLAEVGEQGPGAVGLLGVEGIEALSHAPATRGRAPAS